MPDLRELFSDPEEAQRALWAGIQKHLYTALPCIVVEDSDGHTVKLQPAIKRQDTDPTYDTTTYQDMPLLVDVPVHHPGGGGITATFPIKKGDEILAVFSSRSIDTWHQSGGVQQPVFNRLHSLSDAMAIPGWRSTPRKIPNISTEAAQLRTDNGDHVVTLHPQDGLSLKSTAKVMLDAPSHVIKGDLTVQPDDEGRGGNISVKKLGDKGTGSGGNVAADQSITAPEGERRVSRNWLRACSLYVTDQGGKSTPDLGKLRVRFNIVSHTLQSPNIAEIIVSNPSRDTVALVQKEFTRITLSGGYEGNTGVLFSGSVVQSQYGEKEFNTDPLLRIWASDSDTAYNNSTLNLTLAAGAKPQDIVNASLDALKPFGVTLGQIVGVDLSQPAFPRGVVLSGMVRDHLREVTTSKNANFYIENGQISIFGKNASLSGEVLLSATTGMVGQPVQQPAGIIVRCLINPLIHVNSNVKISASSIVQTKFSNPTLQTSDAYQQSLLEQQQVNAGTYRVLHIDTNADTRGGAWFQTLTCIGASASVNAVQAGLGYS